MKYIAEDGKIFENEHECLAHERSEREKKLKAETEKKEKEKKQKERLEFINDQVKIINEAVRSYQKDYEDNLVYTVDDNGDLFVNRYKNGYDMINDLFSLFNNKSLLK
ncbi:hypothetical protein KQI61_06020 [Anaerocolumna aminovalerica]|uniref:hypothetical protein n=1 Tax=Anaerocolumna aminovalerica TaxID=1527 RepID=UPI001C0EBF83|nr:hypothetical protein [Anaerocolumna aminovalerica]MBU5331747.1 hypothetical protein [Anaerocolumna aminovalerica]